MEVQPITRWVIFYQGFSQRLATFNGIEKLWREADHALSGPYTRVEIYHWYESVSLLAQRIKQFSPEDCDPEVILVSFSWGSATALQLARQLGRRSITVKHLISCDGVHRSRRWLGQWEVGFPEHFPLWVPPNVLEVSHFRQKKSWPRGHVVKAEDPIATKLHPVEWLDAEHCWMDLEIQFRAEVRKAWAEWQTAPIRTAAALQLPQ